MNPWLATMRKENLSPADFFLLIKSKKEKKCGSIKVCEPNNHKSCCFSLNLSSFFAYKFLMKNKENWGTKSGRGSKVLSLLIDSCAVISNANKISSFNCKVFEVGKTIKLLTNLKLGSISWNIYINCSKMSSFLFSSIFKVTSSSVTPCETSTTFKKVFAYLLITKRRNILNLKRSSSSFLFLFL